MKYALLVRTRAVTGWGLLIICLSALLTVSYAASGQGFAGRGHDSGTTSSPQLVPPGYQAADAQQPCATPPPRDDGLETVSPATTDSEQAGEEYALSPAGSPMPPPQIAGADMAANATQIPQAPSTDEEMGSDSVEALEEVESDLADAMLSPTPGEYPTTDAPPLEQEATAVLPFAPTDFPVDSLPPAQPVADANSSLGEVPEFTLQMLDAPQRDTEGESVVQRLPSIEPAVQADASSEPKQQAETSPAETNTTAVPATAALPTPPATTHEPVQPQIHAGRFASRGYDVAAINIASRAALSVSC